MARHVVIDGQVMNDDSPPFIIAEIGHIKSCSVKDVATTMIYAHVLNRGPAGVQSPADRMLGG